MVNAILIPVNRMDNLVVLKIMILLNDTNNLFALEIMILVNNTNKQHFEIIYQFMLRITSWFLG